jgi:L-aminopeptidase/D-esterase-like protein
MLSPWRGSVLAELTFDFPRLRVGCAEYPEGPTGCTVFVFDRGVLSSADIRGGSVGSVLADEYGFLKAICFAGGSLLGLEAASGVAASMFADRGHESVQWADIPAVAGAIVYDFDRPTSAYPDKELGAAAYRAAVPGRFPIGRVGAAANTFVGKGMASLSAEPGGQGGAFAQFGEAKVAVFTVLNSIGAVVARDGRVVRGHLDRSSGRRSHLHEALAQGVRLEGAANQNTALTLVVTNQKLAARDLRQFGRQVHASMARAIQPFHTPFDGDVLFAVTTAEVLEPRLADVAAIGSVASEVAWDAVLSAVET